MISTRDFLQAVQPHNSDASDKKIGTVVSLDPLVVHFDDEAPPEPVDTPRISSYVPAVGDRAVAEKYNSVWVLIGRMAVGLVEARVPPGTLVAQFWRTSTQPVTNNTIHTVTFTDSYNPMGTSFASGVILPPWPGMWRADIGTGWVDDAVGRRDIWLRDQNDADVIGSMVSDTPTGNVTGSGYGGPKTFGIKYCNGVTDAFKMVVRQTSGGDLSVNTTLRSPVFHLTYVGPNLGDDEVSDDD